MTRDTIRPQIEAALSEEHIVAVGAVKDGSMTVFVERLTASQAKLEAAFPDGSIGGVKIILQDAGTVIRDRWARKQP